MYKTHQSQPYIVSIAKIRLLLARKKYPLNLILALIVASFWASQPTNSNGVNDKGWEGKTFRVETDEGNSAIGPILLSSRGLRYLERSEELTHNEVETLLNSDLPSSQYTYMLMQWVGV